jgi:hypothetical protein
VRRGLGVVVVAIVVWGGLGTSAARGQKPPLLAEKDVAALANELSGETAKRNLEVIATFHRQRGSKGFHMAAELVAERAQRMERFSMGRRGRGRLGTRRWGNSGRSELTLRRASKH